MRVNSGCGSVADSRGMELAGSMLRLALDAGPSRLFASFPLAAFVRAPSARSRPRPMVYLHGVSRPRQLRHF
jgi:hypothetical protein